MAMALIDKPTIAAIDGVCAGGGMSLALSFDIRYVGPQAKFLTVFTRRALGPDCGLTYHLPRLVGQGRALELMYTSREVDAEEAVRIGLANTLVDDPRSHALYLTLCYIWDDSRNTNEYDNGQRCAVRVSLRHPEETSQKWNHHGPTSDTRKSGGGTSDNSY